MKPPSERNQAMLVERRKGRTYRSIGQDHGISAERVRQICYMTRRYNEDHILDISIRHIDCDCMECRPWTY